MATEINEITGSFASISWHDCELLRIELLQIYDERRASSTIDVNPVVRAFEGKLVREKFRMDFNDCQFFATSLDLPYLLSSRMSIDSALYYSEISEIKEDYLIEIIERYRGKNGHLLKNGPFFFFEMMEPGGEILIQASSFHINKY